MDFINMSIKTIMDMRMVGMYVAFGIAMLIFVLYAISRIVAVASIKKIFRNENNTMDEHIVKVQWVVSHPQKNMWVGVPWRHKLKPKVYNVPEWDSNYSWNGCITEHTPTTHVKKPIPTYTQQYPKKDYSALSE